MNLLLNYWQFFNVHASNFATWCYFFLWHTLLNGCKKKTLPLQELLISQGVVATFESPVKDVGLLTRRMHIIGI